MSNQITSTTKIEDLEVGDTINHRGSLLTVNNDSIKYDSLMGWTLFGDSYVGGRESVTKVNWIVPVGLGFAIR